MSNLIFHFQKLLLKVHKTSSSSYLITRLAIQISTIRSCACDIYFQLYLPGIGAVVLSWVVFWIKMEPQDQVTKTIFPVPIIFPAHNYKRCEMKLLSKKNGQGKMVENLLECD